MKCLPLNFVETAPPPKPTKMEYVILLFDKVTTKQARKMRKPPGKLGLKKFGPGKFWVKKVWAQNNEKV